MKSFFNLSSPLSLALNSKFVDIVRLLINNDVSAEQQAVPHVFDLDALDRNAMFTLLYEKQPQVMKQYMVNTADILGRVIACCDTELLQLFIDNGLNLYPPITPPKYLHGALMHLVDVVVYLHHNVNSHQRAKIKAVINSSDNDAVLAGFHDALLPSLNTLIDTVDWTNITHLQSVSGALQMALHHNLMMIAPRFISLAPTLEDLVTLLLTSPHPDTKWISTPLHALFGSHHEYAHTLLSVIVPQYYHRIVFDDNDCTLLERPDKEGNSPLSYAMKAGNLKMIRLALDLIAKRE